MTNKEIKALGKDMIEAKVRVLSKHGFSTSKIADMLEINEKTVRKILS